MTLTSLNESRAQRRFITSALLAVCIVVVGAGCGTNSVTRVGAVTGPRLGLSGTLIGELPTAVWTAADVVGPNVALFDSSGVAMPGPNGEPLVLTNPTSEDVPLAFRVLNRQGQWLRVQIPERPNGATAWVQSAAVAVRPVQYRIQVDLSAHQVELFRGTDKIAVFDAAIGTSDAPTPVGNFYVDARVILADVTGPYGSGQIRFSGFSTVYQTFDGGRGQAAIHGTNQPSLIGTPVSHGCVRVANTNLSMLVNTVPTGTPVDVVP